VLSEITQQSEWERSSDRPIPGLNAFRQRDPSFDPQALEDRASVIFWRRASADRIGKIDPIRKAATEEFCDSIRGSVVGVAGHPRQYAGECAVGGVELLAILPAAGDSKMDRAVVRVRWSGKVFEFDPIRQRIAVGQDILRTTALVLERQSTARTDPDKSISSAHCPNCGSPESDSAGNACPNCGTVLNDGSRDWVLAQWAPVNDPAIDVLLQQAAESAEEENGTATTAPANAMGLLAWAVKIAAADGTIDARERSSLIDLAAHSSISVQQLDTLIASALAGTLQLPEPADPPEAREWLTAMARIALSDGTLDRSEIELLRTMGTRIGLAGYDIEQLLRRVQAEQVTAARAAQRTGRV
jgi:tellurite resistance protein